MAKFYSKITSSFYDDSLHTEMPADAVPVDDSTYRALLDAQAQPQGATITADHNGNPVATAIVANPKIAAQEALDASDITLLRCVEKSVAIPAAWVTYRAALRAIVSSGTGVLPLRPNYPAGT